MPREVVVGTQDSAVTPAPVRVEFTGTAPYFREFHSAREITKAEFEKISIPADRDYRFTTGNGWTQMVPGDNELLLAYFRDGDSGFQVREA
jgi:hypothetical protein